MAKAIFSVEDILLASEGSEKPFHVRRMISKMVEEYRRLLAVEKLAKVLLERHSSSSTPILTQQECANLRFYLELPQVERRATSSKTISHLRWGFIDDTGEYSVDLGED